MGGVPKDNENHVLLSDIGSTTTKVLLIDVGNHARFVADAEVPTTVEKPDEDVCIGFITACGALEKKTGIPIVSGDGDIKLPYFTTSSAGGGLQMLVIGLTIVDTARSAEKAALGAGGVILKTIAVDDGLHPVERMRVTAELHPDMILMAGGIDGGNVASVVRLAEILSLSNPVPKFSSTAEIPLVFCGNKDAREFIAKILADKFEMSVIANIRPTLGKENIGPAKEKIHELFMENVMERAPGYDELKKWVTGGIIPTPAGVEKIVELYTDSSGEKALVVDIGGATTDIFTNAGGEFRRTVAANVGTSYSVSNILAETGIENIMKHLPADFSEEDVRNYVANKTLNPTYVPEHKWEKAVERATAIEGLRLAWGQHRRLHFKKKLRAFLGIRGVGVYSADFALVGGVKRAESFKVSDIDLIIGAGGVLSHTDTKNEALWMLAEGFLPEGITKLAVDGTFKSPHMGVLAGHDPATALELFNGECLEDIGYVIAPVGTIKRWRNALKVVVKENGSEKVHRLKGGDFLFLEHGGDMEITTAPFVSLENAEGPHGVTAGRRTRMTMDLPVLFDCRGRGEKMIAGVLADSGISAFSSVRERIESAVRETTPDIYEGEYRIERRLPYEGEILIGVGDRVEPNTIVGRNRYG
ncbi:MAG: glutamate mutase L, partial [Candidatus Coatesbacteria bacterium]